MIKTFDRKDIFTVVNAEEAQKYIGQQGYFGCSFGLLKTMIDSKSTETLLEILDEDCLCRFISTSFSSSRTSRWCLFLPAAKVMEVEE